MVALRDAGGVDGFVGGDHDEVFDAGPASAALCAFAAVVALDGAGGGGIGQGFGAEDIVADRFAWVALGQGDMLVGGGVKDDRRPVIGEHLLHAYSVRNVADRGGHFNCGESFSQFALDFENRVFRLVHQHQERGFKAADGAAEFAADAAAGAADEDRLAMQHRPDRAQIHLHRIAAQDIVHADIANLRGLGVARQNILQAGDRAKANRAGPRAVPACANVGLHLRGAAERHDPLHFLIARRGHGDEDFADLPLAADARQAGNRPQHPSALHAGVGLGFVIIQQAHHAITLFGHAGDFAENRGGGLARADDQQADHAAGGDGA